MNGLSFLGVDFMGKIVTVSEYLGQITVVVVSCNVRLSSEGEDGGVVGKQGQMGLI